MYFKLLCLAVGIFMAIFCHSQLINDGGIIVIGNGSLIVINSNFENKNGATITNDGKLEVKGNFLNTAVYNSTTLDDSLLITGNIPSSLTMSNSSLTNLWINKSAPNILVSLLTNLPVNGKLKFDGGNFQTFSHSVTSPVTALFEFGTGKEIYGNVKRTGWLNNMPVIFNQPNMQIQTSGGIAPGDFTVTMIPGGNPSQNEREVSREFRFSYNGGSGFSTAARYPYNDGELNSNLENKIVPWHRLMVPDALWTSKLNAVMRDGVSNFVSITNISSSEITREWKLADPDYIINTSAFLRGAWGNNSMTNYLSAILPLTQPYNVPPFNYPGTESVSPGFFVGHPNVVDWVLVQLRKPAFDIPQNATEATAIGTKAAFILQDGNVVDLDGVSPLNITLTNQGSGFLVLRHRNHLAIMSNLLPSNLTGTYTNDFRILANSFNNPGVSNSPLVILPGSSAYGLWPGNPNADVSVNAGDVTLVRQRANLSSTGYEAADVNMDGGVNGSDLFLTKQVSLLSVLTHSSRNAFNFIHSHLPH